MFKDIIKIIKFTLEQIKENKIKENSCIEMYDVYRELYNLEIKMKLSISFLSRDINHDDIHTSHGSPTKKWLFFVNKQIEEYENVKYSLFCKLIKLDSAHMNNGVLSFNFFSKSINCKVNEYTNIMHISTHPKRTPT